MAIWTRQLAIFVPIAAILTDFYFDRHNLKQQVRAVLGNLLPLLATMVLFLLWGYSLTPPNNEYTSSTERFAFSLRQLNYAIILTGVCATPLWLPNLRQLFRAPFLAVAIIVLPSIFFVFQGESTRTLSSGLWKPLEIFDKTLIWIGDFGFSSGSTFMDCLSCISF